MLKINQP